MKEEGLFRINGDQAILQILRGNICLYENKFMNKFFQEKHDPHLVASLVKRYFKELPVSLITYSPLFSLLFSFLCDNDIIFVTFRDSLSLFFFDTFLYIWS